MKQMKKVIVFALSLALTLSLGMVNAFAATTHNFVFNLGAHVYDYGEAINQVVIKLSGEGLKATGTDLTTSTFTVKASAYCPTYLAGNTDYGTYTNVERTITSASVNSDGNIVLDLKCQYNGAGQGTLDYAGGDIARNLSMVVKYTITQNASVATTSGTTIAADDVTFEQGKIVNDEVDAFSYANYESLNYRYYTPENANDGKKHALIIWFHGNGEGGYNGTENNSSQLRANRGALGFTETANQSTFGGAYVLAPQAPDAWYYNYSKGYLTQAANMIKTFAKTHNVDTSRIYVFGCSAGGYMTTHMAINNPHMFAAVVPTCPAISVAEKRGGVATTDDQIKSLSSQHLWLIQAKNDTTVLEKDAAARMKSLLGDSAIYTPYDNVTVDGVVYPGHWSWIYTARNMPTYNGVKLFTWTAAQTNTNKPAKASIKKLSKGKKKFTVKLTKVTNATGYEISYKKKGASAYKTIKTKKLTKTMTKLSKKTKYTVKVRAYKTIDGLTYYGSYSSTKTVKTK